VNVRLQIQLRLRLSNSTYLTIFLMHVLLNFFRHMKGSSPGFFLVLHEKTFPPDVYVQIGLQKLNSGKDPWKDIPIF
jgi:hypothetical protein